MAGSFGLPWLWVVHILYNKGLEAGDQNVDDTDPTNEGLLDADERKWLYVNLVCCFEQNSAG
jgi:hypothetical protein